MHRKLDWMTALDIDYSISTFDTDPFEPQPDGVGTIFPFAVYGNKVQGSKFKVQGSSPSSFQASQASSGEASSPSFPQQVTSDHGPPWRGEALWRRGVTSGSSLPSLPASQPPGFFIELPYTLPQDSTLFIILEEKTIEIWKRKLDWIADNGGMALINTHPDYMDFENHSHGTNKYPVDYYLEFLSYVKDRYAGQFYHPLCSEVADFWRESHSESEIEDLQRCEKGKQENARNVALSVVRPQRPRLPLRIGMLTYSFYESDARVRRYAETLASRGDSVDVISLRRQGQADYTEIKGVKIYGVQERVRDEKGKFSYLARILKFFFRSAAVLTRKHMKRPYDVVHVHSVPDFEVFAALVAKIAGARVILDIHDPVPDFFAAKFGYGENHLFYKTLRLIEKYSCHYADHIITVTDYWREVIKNRSRIPNEKTTVILNYPDGGLFDVSKVRKRKVSDGYFKVLYPGTLNKHCGLHIAVEAIALLRNRITNLRLDIYGKGTEEKHIRSLVMKRGLERMVFFHDVVPIEEVPNLMVDADIGIALLSGDHAYLRQALNVKLFEFLAMGLPAVATRGDAIERYLGNEVAILSNPNDPADVARCIRELYQNPEKREELRRAGLMYAKKNNWQSQVDAYLDIIKAMLPDDKTGNSSEMQK
jgi:glycosyltransferase involved in cell wall biosynthesis